MKLIPGVKRPLHMMSCAMQSVRRGYAGVSHTPFRSRNSRYLFLDALQIATTSAFFQRVFIETKPAFHQYVLKYRKYWIFLLRRTWSISPAIISLKMVVASKEKFDLVMAVAVGRNGAFIEKPFRPKVAILSFEFLLPVTLQVSFKDIRDQWIVGV